MTYSAIQQPTRARQLLRRCVNLAPQKPLAYVALAENLMLDGTDEEAVDVLQNAIAQGAARPEARRARSRRRSVSLTRRSNWPDPTAIWDWLPN